MEKLEKGSAAGYLAMNIAHFDLSSLVYNFVYESERCCMYRRPFSLRYYYYDLLHGLPELEKKIITSRNGHSMRSA